MFIRVLILAELERAAVVIHDLHLAAVSRHPHPEIVEENSLVERRDECVLEFCRDGQVGGAAVLGLLLARLGVRGDRLLEVDLVGGDEDETVGDEPDDP